ncbi:unnamed protein product [Linum tenue]|uniref:Uncharacterized protein n=1 Tax=Linum tenue TaxID=586396 RepID=A0AAV0QWX9_9ROSI|nr:unnamed protein product [Linum tenue]
MTKDERYGRGDGGRLMAVKIRRSGECGGGGRGLTSWVSSVEERRRRFLLGRRKRRRRQGSLDLMCLLLYVVANRYFLLELYIPLLLIMYFCICNTVLLDPMEPSKDVLEKEQTISDSAILSEIDRTMKRHGVNSRLI